MSNFSRSLISSGLTSDQDKALSNFESWLENDKEGMPFVLSGYAGSGKTFLSIRFLRLVEEKGYCWTVVAPTHKAVGVIRFALDQEGLSPVWHPATIHRLLRLKLKRKGDLEQCEQTEQTANSLEQLGLVLVDEASMVDSTLLEITLKAAYPFKTRLVFVGDSAQLPPVGEKKSPVFSMKRSFNSELKEVVRHQGPVLKLANGFRDGRLPCRRPPTIPIIQSAKGRVACLDKTDWLNLAKKSLKEASISDKPDRARILCYTNRVLETLVPHARRAVHGDMADQLPVLPGEVLITRSAVMAQASKDGPQVGEEPDMVLGSNRELVVNDIKKESIDLAEFGLVGNSDWSVPVINTLSAHISAGELDLTLRLLPAIGNQSRELLDRALNHLRQYAKELGHKKGRSVWRQFFLVRDAFASLGPASVLTVHRSQGSTFGEVFVAPDIFWPKEDTLRKQLAYVAVSRAEEAVWLVGEKGSELDISLWKRILSNEDLC